METAERTHVFDTRAGEPSTPAVASGWPAWLERGLVAGAVVAAATWVWLSWCIFPLRSWNDIRLAPSFALTLGLTAAAGEHEVCEQPAGQGVVVGLEELPVGPGPERDHGGGREQPTPD